MGFTYKSLKKYDNLYLGLLIGILAPIVILLVYYQLNFSYLSVNNFIFKMFVGAVLVPLLSLCTIANLGVFYLFIWKERYYSARGVIFATILYAIVVFTYKLM